LQQIAHVGVSPSRNLKLFGREIIFHVFQPMRSRYLNVTDGRTDRRHTVAITALCIASRGKKLLSLYSTVLTAGLPELMYLANCWS